MNKKTVNILDIPFIQTTKHLLLQEILQMIKNREKRFIVTANPEIVMHAKKDPKYKEVIQSADFVIPDGIGIIIASKILRNPLYERIAGFDLMMDFLTIANDHSLKVYLLGAEDDIVKKAAEEIQRKYPNIQIVGYHHGYFDLADEQIALNIRKTNPDFVFVALGFPRQEFWIHQYLHLFESGFFMGVGGSFDVIAGKTKRAPKIWQKLYLEWFYRLLQQPSRWRRMLALPKFLLEIFKVRFFGNEKESGKKMDKRL